jgi:hypothetical protein
MSIEPVAVAALPRGAIHCVAPARAQHARRLAQQVPRMRHVLEHLGQAHAA